MALQAKDNYFDTGSAGKPPRFNKDNFSLWKTRMELFLSGSDPQIPYFLENGPHVPTQTVHAIPARTNYYSSGTAVTKEAWICCTQRLQARKGLKQSVFNTPI
ncbi:hypothetical protein OSB04_011294 [Centaurea solstitialis]|uniref:DUF4219 domain-containing protein n=1 Tax=Centaurea solstitialis TaxID=347529 RepID=A0AA38T959_9ASTR|nr:hypothetical protein OSB04_011294 [Centaurea solstitialis]